MAEANMVGLDADFKKKLDAVLATLTRKGYRPRVASAVRTIEEQKEKVKKGYSQTLNSKHISGKAADVIDRRWGWDVPKTSSYWKDLGAAAKAEGLTWGGDWKSFYDPAHVEMP